MQGVEISEIPRGRCGSRTRGVDWSCEEHRWRQPVHGTKKAILTNSNPYQGHPCHIEIILSVPSSEVARSKDLDVSAPKKGKKVAAIEA